ncbi:MAG: response regulator [Clostridiales bacterium]
MSDRKLNILIVDDDLGITNSLKRILKNDSANIFTVSSYEEAMLISKNEKLDILVTDYLMIDVNGTYLIKKLKELDDDLYIIIFTGNPDLLPSEVAKEKYQIDKYVEKSDSFDELIKVVDEAIIIKKYLNEKLKTRQTNSNKNNILNIISEEKNIHKKIKEERMKLKLTQKQLAKKLGVTRGTIANYESSQIPPNNQLVELANIFNVSIDYLLMDKKII